jgi:hypothetical protein
MAELENWYKQGGWLSMGNGSCIFQELQKKAESSQVRLYDGGWVWYH